MNKKWKIVSSVSKKRFVQCVLYNRISDAMLFRLLCRVTAVCALPPQSTDLAINIGKLLALGVAPSALPLAALKELMQRPGILPTPRDLQAWAEIEVLHGSTLRAALDGFAYSNTPIPSHYVACRLLGSCIGLHASNEAVKYLAPPPWCSTSDLHCLAVHSGHRRTGSLPPPKDGPLVRHARRQNQGGGRGV